MDATSKTPGPMVPLRTASSVARPVARSPSSSVFSATFRAATRAAGATAFTCISNTLAPMHGHSTRAGGVRGTAARLTDRFVAGNRILRAYRRRTTAAANSRVDAPPSRSRVRIPSSLTVRLMAVRRRCAKPGSPTWSSINPPASNSEMGFAIPLPAMSGAEPCTASNIAACSPIFAPGARPSPPARPAISSERMSPNRFVATITSNCHGSVTSCIAQASTMRSFISMRPSNSLATSRPVSRKSPDNAFSTLALWTTVTRLRPFRSAYSNANLLIRRAPTPGIHARRNRYGTRVVTDCHVVLKADVQPLEVFADQHQIDVVVAAAAEDGAHGTDIGVQPELFPQAHIDGPESAADRRRKGPLEREPRATDALQCFGRQGIPTGMNRAHSTLLDVPDERRAEPVGSDLDGLEDRRGGSCFCQPAYSASSASGPTLLGAPLQRTAEHSCNLSWRDITAQGCDGTLCLQSRAKPIFKEVGFEH